MRVEVQLLSLFLVVLSTTALPRASLASDSFCEAWSDYVWAFHSQPDPTNDPVWSQISSVNQQLTHGRRLAAVGGVSPNNPLPFPSIPSLIEANLDSQTQLRVRSLYERYILLGRRIEDEWNDKYQPINSETALQRFIFERDQLVSEMNKVAAAARVEFEHYGLREKNCFSAFVDRAQEKVQDLNEQLSSANSALKFNDSVWSHAYPTQDLGRAPASNGEPAVVQDSDSSAPAVSIPQ